MVNPKQIILTKDEYLKTNTMVCETLARLFTEEPDLFNRILELSLLQPKRDQGKLLIDHVVGYLNEIAGHYEVRVMLYPQRFVDGETNKLMAITMWFSAVIHEDGGPDGTELPDIRDEHFVTSLTDMRAYIKVFATRESAIKELSALLRGELPSSKHLFAEKDTVYS